METNLQAIWSERIVAYQASGQTMKAWCQEHSLTVHQLKYWLYKAQRRTQVVSTPAFRPVALASTSGTIECLPYKSVEPESRFGPASNRDCFVK
ncbi:hypothetical protein O9H85_35570 [Paenibacillus filicis]|uniref:Transposase n=1 Tax=Paenibacillus gyeongsangnamensis TaxID=3388067 RepID=A0ABT4QL46_9BACL|nr:hypothetical protein [Paenibacillus filicis]MCZ8517565.1 hypothetical protein [Paenibacillus filicis]